MRLRAHDPVIVVVVVVIIIVVTSATVTLPAGMRERSEGAQGGGGGEGPPGVSEPAPAAVHGRIGKACGEGSTRALLWQIRP